MSYIDDKNLTIILFAILVKRLGGSVVITQGDIDDIAYNQLIEEGHEDGSLSFQLNERSPRQ